MNLFSLFESEKEFKVYNSCENIFKGPKGYIAQICEVHLQY